MTHRNWVFTLNNPSQKLTLPPFAKYLVYQLEKVSTPHYQGYIQLKRQQRLSYLRKWLPTAHWEPARGLPQQCKDYCTKEDSRVDGPWEFGTMTSQGLRNDLIEMKKMIDSGASDEQVADYFFGNYLRYSSGISRYRLLKSKPRFFKPKVIWIYGPSGVGKTACALDIAGKNAYMKDSSKWWDAYNGTDNIIIDDFEWSEYFTYKQLLRIFDRYPMQVQVKNAYVNFAPRKIIVTSDRHPSEIFQKKYDFQLQRRIQVCHVTDAKSSIVVALKNREFGVQ